MKMVSKYSLGHAKNRDTNYAIFDRTSCPPFGFFLITYFFKLLLDQLSDFHQIQVCWQKVMDFVSIDETVIV